MKKTFIIIFIIFILTACTREQEISKVCFDQACFKVELAQTNAEKRQGLMHRQSLDENKGMLFIFEKEDIYAFWMKNTLIPLDMIWISENMEVVSIYQNAQPCKTEQCESIRPLRKAKYVLEINGGIVTEKGIEVHDNVEFKY